MSAAPPNPIPAGARLAPVAAVVAALLLGLAAAWVVPILSVLVVWPLLFVVPGWGLLAAAGPRIAGTGRLGLAIVLSVAISAHLVYWLAVATGGYRRETIFAAALLLALPIPLAAARGGLPALLDPIRGAARSLARERIGFGVAVLAGGVVGLLLAAPPLALPAPGGPSGGPDLAHP